MLRFLSWSPLTSCQSCCLRRVWVLSPGEPACRDVVTGHKPAPQLSPDFVLWLLTLLSPSPENHSVTLHLKRIKLPKLFLSVKTSGKNDTYLQNGIYCWGQFNVWLQMIKASFRVSCLCWFDSKTTPMHKPVQLLCFTQAFQNSTY